MNFAANRQFEPKGANPGHIFLRPHGSLFPAGAEQLHMTRVPKKVVAVIGETTIAESRRVIMLHEKGYTPVYYFPREDVAMEALTRLENMGTFCPRKGNATYFSARAVNGREEKVAWSYENPIEPASEIASHIAFYFDQVDRWFEDGDEIFGSPADPFVRIDIRSLGGELEIEHNGSTIVRTTRAKVLYETGLMPRFYVPAEDVLAELQPKRQQTTCIYKGRASYADVLTKNEVLEDAAWVYRSPVRECEEVALMWCFDFERFDAHRIDGTPVLFDPSFDRSRSLLKRGDKLG